MGKKIYLSDFEQNIIVGDTQGCLSISGPVLLGLLHPQLAVKKKKNCFVAQISGYIPIVWNIKQTCFSSKTPHWVSLLFTKNGKLNEKLTEPL